MKKEKVLILGGTQFIGRNLVEHLADEGVNDIYLFNRQKTGTQLFPNIKKIKGDRHTDDIDQIKEINWDYVIDVSCYYPADLTRCLACINSDVKNYVFISTCSVYDGSYHLLGRNEAAPLLDCTPEQASDTSDATYGCRKAECERRLRSSGIKYTILRPALVFGPYDHTDRLYYWLHQVHTSDQLLVPQFGGSLFSITYVKDLVRSVMRILNAESKNETYNVVNKIQFSIGQLIQESEMILKKRRQKINAPATFLHEENVRQWVDMPLWLDNDYFTYDNSKIKDNLRFEFTDIGRALRETIDYYNSIDWPKPQFGMNARRKNALLNKRLSG